MTTSSAARPQAQGQAGWVHTHGSWDPIGEPGNPARQRLSFWYRPRPAGRRGVAARPPPAARGRLSGTLPSRRRPWLKPTPTRGRTRSAAALPPPEPCKSAPGPAGTRLTGDRGARRRACGPVGCGRQQLSATAARGGSAAPQPSHRHSRETRRLGAGPEGGASRWGGTRRQVLGEGRSLRGGWAGPRPWLVVGAEGGALTSWVSLSPRGRGRGGGVGVA